MIRRAALALALLAGPAGAVEQLVSGALILHPEGLYVRYDARFPLGGGLSVGVFDSWQVYGNGVGVQLGWQADPAWIETHVDVSAEPGYYVQRPDDARIGPGIDGTADAADRAFGWRGVAAWQTQINLRSGGFWLYSRTTALARLRSFVEADTFQQQQVGHELALDQATAAMGRIAGDDAHAAWWIYGEYTVGGVLDVGTRPHRVSAGVIAERWPADAVTLNLDLFYSVAPSPLDGPGLIAAWWIRW